MAAISRARPRHAPTLRQLPGARDCTRDGIPRRLGLRRGSQRLAGESQDWEAVLPPPAPRYRRRYIKNTSGEQTMRIPLGNS